MTTISIDTNIYKSAEKYARQNNISVHELVENTLRKFLAEKKETGIRPVSELHPSVRALIGVGRRAGDEEIKDINAREVREEYFKEKYADEERLS